MKGKESRRFAGAAPGKIRENTKYLKCGATSVAKLLCKVHHRIMKKKNKQRRTTRGRKGKARENFVGAKPTRGIRVRKINRTVGKENGRTT